MLLVQLILYGKIPPANIQCPLNIHLPYGWSTCKMYRAIRLDIRSFSNNPKLVTVLPL